MTKQRLEYLLERYLEGALSAGEQEEWHDVFENNELKGWLEELIDSNYYQLTEEELVGLPARKADEIFTSIIKQEPQTGKGKAVLLWRRLAIAASVLLVLSTGAYYIFRQQPVQQIAHRVQDIKAGSNGAILTLSNGQKIILEQTKTGAITEQNGSSLHKTGDSSLVYRATAATANDKPGYNTLETPKGRQYSVVLPDGSKVWLNAASSLKYPTAFSNSERLVELNGEAYFEVIHNSRQPFRVKTRGQFVEDIGTHFNINAYHDETTTRTTLLEGVVKVNGVLLKPGQQSDGKSIQSVDTEEIVAWKNGVFQFDNADIKTVMRQLIRWYDVDIRYQGNVSDVHYTGLVTRRSNISAVLKMLKETGGTDYKIEGKTVTIIK